MGGVAIIKIPFYSYIYYTSNKPPCRFNNNRFKVLPFLHRQSLSRGTDWFLDVFRYPNANSFQGRKFDKIAFLICNRRPWLKGTEQNIIFIHVKAQICHFFT